MSSKSTYEYYKDDLTKISPIRAIAESIFNEQNDSGHIFELKPKELYELACEQPGVTVTDMPMHPASAKFLGLDPGAKVINDNHGKIVGRDASARRFYDRSTTAEKNTWEGIVREAAFEMHNYELITATGVIGVDKDMMIKARIVAPASDAANMFFWNANFTPMDAVKEAYESSRELPVQDILVVCYPEWKSPDPQFKVGCVIVDAPHNVIFVLGLRYFGERKKGTLTLAWTSGMRLGVVASHGGIKEIDFSECEAPANKAGKQIIAFYGLSGSGKSSHTNALDNDGSLPKGIKRKIAHDDAFQIDCENSMCYVWEPSLFDKTDQRNFDHPDWEYCIGTQNQTIMDVDNKRLVCALDTRNRNGRAIFSRDLLGEVVNRIPFPNSICWLMKDSTLPPITKLANTDLAVAMGATLMTKRSAAENVPLEMMNKLVFEPYANPFRVYELYKDCEGFNKVFEFGAKAYVFNSGGFWNTSDTDLKKIPLKLSLRLQTALLLDEIEWVDWPLIPGAQVPSAKSIDAIWPEYSKTYDVNNVANAKEYLELLKDRFAQRREFLKKEVAERPDIMERLVKILVVKD